MAHGAGLTWCLAPKLRTITVLDAGRDWTGSQNIGVIFSEACSGDATGWSCTVNGVTKTLTYVSGSGTQNWVMQIAAAIHHGDVIRLNYDTASGATVSTSDSVEINGLTAVQLPDQLSKRIRFILRDSQNALVASQSVKAFIAEYDSGVVENAPQRLFGARTDKATVVTDAAGQFDMQYTGVAAVGGYAYVAVVEVPSSAPGSPSVTESMLVRDTVV
jgi:hypothetical protein